MSDGAGLTNLISNVKPTEIYNLAAQSHVKVSFTMPHYTASVDGIGAVTILEAIRSSSLDCRYYQASTSELFGATPPPQSEASPFYPRSPYAAAKLYAYWVTVIYREAYGIHATNGILFNHESPRRGETFVTRKITRAVAAIKNGDQKELFLGNLDAVRDWGYAKEYVEGMWLMLQQETPDDFVAATGVGATIKDFCDASFSSVGLNWEDYVKYDPQYLRPTEVDALIGDPSKAREKLGWEPKMRWKELAELMVDADMKNYLK
jgi:GDPmannose 4,6-dehydratase